MPELPEVETIKNELSPWVVGQSFTKVTISDTKLVCGGSAEEVCHTGLRSYNSIIIPT